MIEDGVALSSRPYIAHLSACNTEKQEVKPGDKVVSAHAFNSSSHNIIVIGIPNEGVLYCLQKWYGWILL